MRIAWLGPSPSSNGGVANVATLLLIGLAQKGVEVDCYIDGDDAVPPFMREEPKLKVVRQPVSWSWNRWYSRSSLGAFVSGQIAHTQARRNHMKVIANTHDRQPYDLLYQFSHIEVFRYRHLARRLPPLVLHPEVHAEGELRWHRKEAMLAAHCESRLWTVAVRAMLNARSWRQSRDIRMAKLVVAPSRVFAEEIVRDYGLPRDAITIVRNPIDLGRFQPMPEAEKSQVRTILVVSRISVRKGIEMVVDLSKRLRDLRGKIRLLVVGNRTLWSNYLPLLEGLNKDIAEFVGYKSADEIAELMRRSDALLQPSQYEPFGLSVAEALASGTPVVVSDRVGASELVDSRCCYRFRSSNSDEFEVAVRSLLDAMATTSRKAIRELARSEAERLYSPSTVAGDLARALENASDNGAPSCALMCRCPATK